jgi:hypothetical protein
MHFKTFLFPIALSVGLVANSVAWAQAPGGSTGQCKDNSYTTAESKRGACRGHGGVKDWYATEKAAPSPRKGEGAESKPTMPETQNAKPLSKTATARVEAAAGGGAGKVWVNTASNVYHCEGTRWYGKTKKGEYMSEADAKAKGAHADHGKACG